MGYPPAIINRSTPNLGPTTIGSEGQILILDADGELLWDDLPTTDLTGYATEAFVATALEDYLPLTGGTLSGNLTLVGLVSSVSGVNSRLITSGSTLQIDDGAGGPRTINHFGNYYFATGNTYDIGASGGNQPRNIYVGTSVILGSSGPQINNNAGVVRFQNNAGSALAGIQAATVDNPSAALTLGNATYGVSVPGAITASGNVITPGGLSFSNTGFVGGGVAVGRGASAVAGDQINLYYSFQGSKIALVGSQGINIANDHAIRLSSTSTSSGTPDAIIKRYGTGQVGVYGDNGLILRNYADSGYTPLTCSTIQQSQQSAPTIASNKSGLWVASGSGTKDGVAYDQGDVLFTSNVGGASKTLLVLDWSAL